jgi:hypothetical protein
MKTFLKAGVVIPVLALAGCGGGAAVVVANIFDQINAVTKTVCGYTFVFATIDAMIKAFGGPPVAETIGGLLCTQARALASQQAPKAAGVTAGGQATVTLGTVIINGKPVTITVLR